ncbi:unnamed protein product [Orchesella dallaii]|uniref:Methyltransferase domain-containing protein n=1 Tax=Orchesella dallaii TaxID=48710 RepID=A0ABP1R2P3_9HEXA
MKQQIKSEPQNYLSSYRTLLLIGVIIITFVLLFQFLHVFTFLKEKVQSGFNSLSSSSSTPVKRYDQSHPAPDKYHNTLIVDIDIRKNPKLAKAEEIWERSRRGHSKNPKNYQWGNISTNLFPPTFNCPHFTERLGDGKWVCGLELFENHPECVIYSFRKTVADLSFEAEILKRTKYCRIFIYSQEMPNIQPKSRVQYQNLTLSTADNENPPKKILRTLLRQNGHGWIDILHVDMRNSQDFPVLKQIIEDFEVLPWGQLQMTQEATAVDGNIEAGNNTMFLKFLEVFAQLEMKGLRPFHAQIAQQSTCNATGNSSLLTLDYSFINVRGKHLLITNGLIQ